MATAGANIHVTTVRRKLLEAGRRAHLPETDVTRSALYADDTLAYTTHRNADLAIGRLQRHVRLIEEWFQHWRLLVNIMKSQVIAFSRTRSVPQTKLTLYGTALEFQDAIKYLGIHLNSRLLWHTNIANTRAKTIARMVQLRCNEQEMLPHILGFCHHGELFRINRHNTVRSLIASSVHQNASYEVYEEIGCISFDGSTRLADIIVIDRQKDNSVILDPTIRFEMLEQQP
ncbi:hypothetical protein ANN_20682 [Periplaneta americana]|uniref:Reverse transcriptase domain-containing protein n=1 Tax=Periplaneta americana TaxID=6978 RepID=A0ABQ8SDQ8_PERAM|nr:hypothetical protein ANN_20682 [Periplaneta americana]